MEYSLSVVFCIMSSHDSINSSPFQLHFQVGEQPKIARSHVGRVGSLSNHRNVVFWPRKFESVARNELVRCHNAAAMFHGHSPHGQIIGQNGMYRTSVYPHLLRKFSDGDTTVLHDQVRTWSMSSSFRLVDGLPERASLSTDVRPSLNRLYHSLICVMPMASSPKTR